jgi:hypothetical protein
VQFLSHGREIVDHLYIGGRLVAENDSWLDENVDFIVNASGKRFLYMNRYDAGLRI